MQEDYRIDPNQLIFIHGLEGSSQGVKASLLRGIFPGMLTPDFRGDLQARMQKLESILGEEQNWTIVGSSFGGLMGALFASRHPTQVRKLVLLAPALIWPDFAQKPPDAVNVPTVVFHGKQDKLIPLQDVQELCEQVFTNLEFNAVEDDHGLYKTVHEIDWLEVLKR